MYVSIPEIFFVRRVDYVRGELLSVIMYSIDTAGEQELASRTNNYLKIGGVRYVGIVH